MRRLLHTLAFLCCLLSVNAQTVWLGSVDNDWTNAANWSAGVPTSGSTVTLPASPAGGNFPTFSGSSFIDFTIQNAGVLTFNTFIYNNGTIVNFGGGQIINNDRFLNGGGKLLDNDGHFENNGILDNYGTVDIAASGSMDNEGGATLNNFGSFISFGPVLNNGVAINNSGTMVIVVALENNSTLNNNGIFESQFGSILTNSTSGNIDNATGAEFSANGTFTNDATITNAGEMLVQNAGVLTNNGTITTSNLLEIAGNLINESALNNQAMLMINSAGRLENNATVSNNGTILLEICGLLIQNANNTIGGDIQNDGLVYEINGSVNETNLEFGLTYTDINDTPAPVPACKRDVILQIDETGIVNFTAADIDQGRSYGSCGATLESYSITPTSFTSDDVGVQIVTLTITDNFGNSSSCDDFVTVLPFTPPIVPNDDAEIEFDCPVDVMVSTQAGAQFAPAEWTVGDATTTCAPVGGSTIGCSTIPTTIAGFTYMGEMDGSRYFVSNETATWTQANINAIANGGQLVTISSIEENNFVTNNTNPSSGSVWIGYNNVNNGADFQWVSGEDNSYINWQDGEPNGSPNDHAARLKKENGLWTDRHVDVHFEYVIEIACFDDAPDCTVVPNSIPGTIYLGEYNNSKYYCTENNNYTWPQARDWAEANGGHLVIVNDQAENDFVQSVLIADYGWIGLTDEATEGTYVWVDGQVRDFYNWNDGEPNNSGGNEDYVRLLTYNGKWTDRNATFLAEGVMEIPCPSEEPPVCEATGTITIETWNNISGVAVSLIPVNTPPSESGEVGIFEASTNIADNYGTRIRGYIFPPETGDYRFWIASDDNGELWLSTDDNPANKQLIANVPSWTNSREWGKFPEQRSALITLQAGQRYYIEALAKEQVGGDNLAVGWRLPNGNYNRPVSGSYLSPWDGGNTSCGGNGDPELTITQIGGPLSGSNFPVGETVIAYEVTDACGNEEVCTFHVVVDEVPAEFALTDCPTDITLSTLPGAETAVATWTDPSGTSTCFRGGPIGVTQTFGFDNGEDFPIGTTSVGYAVFDSCGNFESCIFTVTVEEVTANLDINCPENISFEIMDGSATTPISWVDPTATGTCFTNNIGITQVFGPANGDEFPVGETEVGYIITDGCNNTEFCSFTVIVTDCPDDDGDGVCTEDDCDDNDPSIPAPPGTPCDDGDANSTDDIIQPDGCTCQGTITPAISITGTTVEEDAGTVLVEVCIDLVSNVDVTAQYITNSGTALAAQDFVFGIGTVTIPAGDLCANISIEIIDDGAEEDTEDFTVDLNSPANATIDVAQATVMILANDPVGPCDANGGDEDGDGFCADVDCDDTDASIIPLATGTACDDGDVNTENDAIEADGCNCSGTLIDADGDGSPITEDCDDNDPSIPTAPGTACDDGDANTENDVIGADGCSCSGTLIDADGDGSPITEDCDDNDPSIPTAPGTDCDDGDANTENDVIGADGCTCAGTPIDPCASNGGDGDGDGFCADVDCDDTDASIIPLAPGTACDDGDMNTENDAIEADGCSCSGTLIDADGDGSPITEDCDDNDPNIPTAPGTTCDDGDANTENDAIEADGCSCSGTLIDADGDGSPITEDCDDNDPSIPTAPGTTCDDGDANTENDVIGADGCSCSGTLIDGDGDGSPITEDCDDNDPSIPTAPGTACDDGDANTENDVIGADGCSCAGTPIQTGCNPMYTLTPGGITITGLIGLHNSVNLFDTDNGWAGVFSCFDDCDNPTVLTDLPAGNYYLHIKILNELYQIECEIAEYIEITEGCTEGAACDDGDICTENDVYDADCNCVGTTLPDNDGDGFCSIEDCNDNDASIPAAPGTACDDGNPDTTDDVILADGCTCEGIDASDPCAANGGDGDGDGFCADVDCDDTDASIIPLVPGTACDDGDANTENDTIGADGCSCAGTPITTGCNPTYVVGPGTITISGLTAPHNSINLFDTDNGWAVAFSCFDDCGNPSIITDLPAGNYYLHVKLLNDLYQIECEITENLVVPDGCTEGAACDDGDICTENDAYDADCNCIGTALDDLDGDGYCSIEDCDDGDASIPAPVGSTCDDDNPDTTNDVILADGCTCQGTDISDPCVANGGDADGDGFCADVDCDDTDASIIPLAAGTTCDDGDADTENDVIGADGCSCAGTPIVTGCTAAFEAIGDTIHISGLTAENVAVTVFDATWGTVFSCFGDCDVPDQHVQVTGGTYFVKVQMWDASFTPICTVENYLTVGGSTSAIVAQSELLYFDAHKADRAVVLAWTTNTEYKNDYFEIERSIDGINFDLLTERAAYQTESNQPINYQLIDENPLSGRNFYRVKQYFVDGTSRYTDVKEVLFDLDLNAFVLYPNPTNEQIFVSLREFVGMEANIQVYNQLGVLMDRQIVESITTNPIEFDVQQYPAGQYTITVKVKDRKRMNKHFIKGRL